MHDLGSEDRRVRLLDGEGADVPCVLRLHRRGGAGQEECQSLAPRLRTRTKLTLREPHARVNSSCRFERSGVGRYRSTGTRIPGFIWVAPMAGVRPTSCHPMIPPCDHPAIVPAPQHAPLRTWLRVRVVGPGVSPLR